MDSSSTWRRFSSTSIAYSRNWMPWPRMLPTICGGSLRAQATFMLLKLNTQENRAGQEHDDCRKQIPAGPWGAPIPLPAPPDQLHHCQINPRIPSTKEPAAVLSSKVKFGDPASLLEFAKSTSNSFCNWAIFRGTKDEHNSTEDVSLWKQLLDSFLTQAGPQLRWPICWQVWKPVLQELKLAHDSLLAGLAYTLIQIEPIANGDA
jgi:hypothetical protein